MCSSSFLSFFFSNLFLAQTNVYLIHNLYLTNFLGLTFETLNTIYAFQHFLVLNTFLSKCLTILITFLYKIYDVNFTLLGS